MKNLNYKVIILICIITLCLGCCKTIKTYPEASIDCKTITMEELDTIKEKVDCYTIEGYIAYMQTCPPCPKGALCKPCPPDYIYVRTKKHNSSADFIVSKNDILIYTENNPQFKIGSKYKFSVKTAETPTMIRHSNFKITQYNLIGYSNIKNN